MVQQSDSGTHLAGISDLSRADDGAFLASGVHRDLVINSRCRNTKSSRGAETVASHRIRPHHPTTELV